MFVDMLKKQWCKNTALIVFCMFFVYILIYADVWFRARSAYIEGEKYWSWYNTPELKENFLSQNLLTEKNKFEKQFSKGKLSEEEYNKQIEILKFNYSEKAKESSIKYAYIWYQTVVELFSPPESKWVKMARKKMPFAKELWKQELRSKNISFEDYMLE